MILCILLRLTIEEEGCARILNRRDTKKILLQLVRCLGIDDGGKTVIFPNYLTFGLLCSRV